MPSELAVHAVAQDGMKIVADAGAHSVQMDYPLQPGEVAAGFRPLELMLASLAGCTGNTMAAMLRRDEQPLEALEVSVRGTRRDEHPTVFTQIDIEFTVRGAVDPARVEHNLAIAEKICPVWAMIAAGTPVSHTYTIVAS